MYTICIGDAQTGFRFEGLFQSETKAKTYANDFYGDLNRKVGVLAIQSISQGPLKGQLTEGSAS